MRKLWSLGILMSLMPTTASWSSPLSPLIIKPGQKTISVYIPSNASITSGMFAITPDSDGFDSTISVSIAGSTMTLGNGYSPEIKMLNAAQISAISLISPNHKDVVNDRDWIMVPIQIDSSSAQTVSISSIGIWYNFFENIHF